MHATDFPPAPESGQPAEPAPAYDSWAEVYDLLEGDRTAFLGFYQGLLTPDTRSVLEIACGTGIIASNLASRLRAAHPGSGIAVVGVDNSPPMLELARKRDPSIEWLLGDMRDLGVASGRFDLVFCCFNTFQFMHTDADLLRAFRSARERVSETGTFAFDLYQPNLPYLAVTRVDSLSRSIQHQGRELQVREDARYEPETRILQLDWRLIDSAAPEAVLARSTFRIRQYFAADIERLLAAAGFAIRERFGSLEREPFSAASKKQVLVCSPV